MFLYVCEQTFRKSKVRIFQKVNDVIMRNLCDTIFYLKTNVLQDFHICMSVPTLTYNLERISITWFNIRFLNYIRKFVFIFVRIHWLIWSICMEIFAPPLKGFLLFQAGSHLARTGWKHKKAKHVTVFIKDTFMLTISCIITFRFLSRVAAYITSP